MNPEIIRSAFSKVKEDMQDLHIELEDIVKKVSKIEKKEAPKKAEVSVDKEIIESLKKEVLELENKFEEYAEQTQNTISTVSLELQEKINLEVSQLRLELTEQIMSSVGFKKPGLDDEPLY